MLMYVCIWVCMYVLDVLHHREIVIFNGFPDIIDRNMYVVGMLLKLKSINVQYHVRNAIIKLRRDINHESITYTGTAIHLPSRELADLEARLSAKNSTVSRSRRITCRCDSPFRISAVSTEHPQQPPVPRSSFYDESNTPDRQSVFAVSKRYPDVGYNFIWLSLLNRWLPFLVLLHSMLSVCALYPPV